MNHALDHYGLHCPDGRQAQLLSVQVHGEILGLMMRLTVRQTWRNASGAPMATRLRFPLAWEQTLLDLQVERTSGPQTLTRVSRESTQHCSATPGVLATGEQVTVQWRIGQLLQLQGGSLRVQLPAGLMPRAPRASQVSLEVHDPVAQGTVSCTSHTMQRVRHANGMGLTMQTPKGLDKDLVLMVHGLRDTGFALASPQADIAGGCTLLVSASARLQEQSGQPVRMKLLVDSSSAMPSERLGSIRNALDKLLDQFQPADQLSFSRFGARTVHDLPRLQVCTEAYQRRLRALARHTDTDLGQPDALAALQAVLGIPDEEEEAVQGADILLITASPLWALDTALRALREHGHRLHVMTVGTAADGLWHELARASGGASERLGPGQHAQQALMRLIQHIRQLQCVQTRLSLEGARLCSGGESLRHLRDADTLHLWAQAQTDTVPHDLTGRPQLQARLHWLNEAQPPEQTWPASTVLWDDSGDLTRLWAAEVLSALPTDDEAPRQQHIAQYGLIVPDLQRMALADPSTPSHRAPAAPANPAMAAPAAPATPMRAAIPALHPTAPVRRLPGAAAHAPLSSWLSEPAAPGSPLLVLVDSFNTLSSGYGQFRAALSCTLQQLPTRLPDGLVLQLARQAGNPGRVWAMLLHWLHSEHELALNNHALQLVQQELASVPLSVRNQIHAAFLVAAQAVATRRAA
jgi:von Willebrand factor type A domain